MRTLSRLFAATLLAGSAIAQPALHLKASNRNTSTRSRGLAAEPKTLTPGRAHWVVQFAANPASDQVRELAARGATVLSYVPDFALSLSSRDDASFEGLGAQWIGRLRPDEKISPLLGRQFGLSRASAVVEFYADVDPGDARSIANSAGLTIRENPDLLPHHLLVSGLRDRLFELAEWDEVSYIFPASPELVRGTPVRGCAGGVTSHGLLGQSVALIDDGWDGPGLGSADLKYSFVHVTEKLPADSAESEIVRALSEWAKYAKLTFSQATGSTGSRTLAVLFASREHGDGYPFDGPGGVLAHTFYPVPTNVEPIAGDMHFDDDESWNIGADKDVFSIALHEAGHALGLGHSDDPADVMFPYYRKVAGLAPGDVTAIQSLYAAQDGIGTPSPAPGVPSAPLTLMTQAPASPTQAASLAMSGAVTGGSGAIQVSWRTSQGAMGTAQGSSTWTIASIPLSVGNNAVTILAEDAQHDQVAQSFFVTRVAANPPGWLPPGNPPTPPSPTPPSPTPPNPSPSPGGAPPSMTILSPPGTNVATSNASIVVSGIAHDSAGIAQVTWSTSNGDTGTASGTDNWTTPPIALYIGTTTIIIRASDAAGNTSWRSLTVTRN